MILLDFLNFVISLLLVFITIIIYSPTNKYKLLKSKEEQLFLQKTLITTIFFSLILFVNVIFILQIGGNTFFYYIELFSFNTYIVVIVLYNFFLSLELYSTYSNPIHYFNRLFRQKRYNYKIEIFIIIIGILTFSIDLLLFKLEIFDLENDHSAAFILMDKWKFAAVFLLSLASIILCILIKKKIKKFCFKKQEKLYSLINKRALANVLYFIYGLFYGLPVIANIEITEMYNIFGSIFFLIIICFDYVIYLSVIATTKFCEYRLGKNLLGYICSCFFKPPKYNTSTSADINESTVNDESRMGSFQTITNTTEFISSNPLDKELVTIYKNGIFIEDYFLNYFDQILNIITVSLFQIYNSKYFSTQANELRLSSKINIDLNETEIPGNNRKKSVINSSIHADQGQVGDEIIRFNLKKNMEKDDFNRFNEILENGLNIQNDNNYFNVNIKSFFTQRCIESIYDQKLKGRNVGQSLLSHVIFTNFAKNKNPDNPNSYFWSLLASNGKEEYFNKLRNTSLKTYDKNFTLDIFDSDDKEINFLENSKNTNLATLLDKYFTYIHGKGLHGTFLPLLVGVYKVKINNFKTLLVFITRNSLVENVPKSYYLYWQLIRFLPGKPQKVASSQFNSGTLVKDDPIFERAFQVENRKDNPDFNKIFIKNYNDFVETIQNDISFLKEVGAQNFDLLLMYYEYENTQKHEKQGKIKIKKNVTGETEFIEESMPKSGSSFDDEAKSIIKFGSKFPDSMDGGFSLKGEFLDGDDFEKYENENKNNGNYNDYNEKISINGYDGIFDSYSCLCFFTFGNVFDIRKRVTLTTNYYNNFQKNILVNFTEFKK